MKKVIPNLDKFIEGTCENMCPLREIQLREEEGLLHMFEMKTGTERRRRPEADHNKIVKAYSRSAAGQPTQWCSDLRPVSTLKKTVRYLLCIAYKPPPDLDWILVYEFVADRLRAVRQDIVIQGLFGQETLQMIEAMTLFHVYAAYRLCDRKLEVFDPKLNSDLLMDCLKRCLIIYDFGADSKQRGLIEATYAIIALENNEALSRLVCLPSDVRCQETKLTEQLCMAILSGNFVRAFRIFKMLPSPLACAFAPHIPSIRRRALKILSIAYSSKVLTVPVSSLCDWLMFSSEESALEESTHYGLQIKEGKVHFQKSSFNEAASTIKFNGIKFLDEELRNCNASEVFALFGK